MAFCLGAEDAGHVAPGRAAQELTLSRRGLLDRLSQDEQAHGVAQLLVNLDVDDMPRAVRFYTEGLGLTVGRRFDRGFVELLGAGAPIYLLLKDAGSKPFQTARAARDYARHWTPVHLDFVVPDLDSALERAALAGAVVESPPSDEAYGRLALLADPFGHGFCLLEFRGRGYDELPSAMG